MRSGSSPEGRVKISGNDDLVEGLGHKDDGTKDTLTAVGISGVARVTEPAAARILPQLSRAISVSEQ